jgi:predicted AAA+ superfamily ATPase
VNVLYIHRALENTILRISESFPALIVTGSRQVGKTTMLKNIADEGRRYVTLDDPVARELAVTEPDLFLERYSPPVLIDEIQYAPQLLPFVKMRIDALKRPGDFWMTGSQMFHMMKNTTESLAGRVAVIQMFGLSQSEQTTGFIVYPCSSVIFSAFIPVRRNRDFRPSTP